MPQVIMKARQVMADPNSSLKDIGSVLETDQAIAAMVLKMANSAYYGLIGMVSSIQHASVVLGHKTLNELITVAGTSQLLGSALKGYGMGSGDLWRHSLAVAFGCKVIADKNAPSLSNDAFSAGLIHDAGKLVLDSHIQQFQQDFKNLNGDDQMVLSPAEKTVLGFDHAEIAFELCKQWNIPPAQSDAIRYHHYHPTVPGQPTDPHPAPGQLHCRQQRQHPVR